MIKRVLTLTMLLALVQTSHASGDPVAGRDKAAQVCVSCHGSDGNGNGDQNNPRLAGQHRDYLEQALHSYRDGTRENAIMQGFAQTLSDEDIANLAAYYAEQQGLSDLSDE